MALFSIGEDLDFSEKRGKLSRDPLFDVVKAIMMLWVIWGHLGLYHIVVHNSESLILMANAKIGVNMPVFFVIGGYLAESTFKNGSWTKIGIRLLSFLWPVVAFGIVFEVCHFVMGHGGEGWRLIFFPFRLLVHGYWFVRTFAVIYLIAAVVYRMSRTNRTRWFYFGVLYFVLLFIPNCLHPFLFLLGGSPTIHMMPYFVFGLMVLRQCNLWKSSIVSLLCGVFFLAVVVLEGDSSTNGMNFWRVSIFWRSVFLDMRNLLCFFGRTAMGLSGSVFILWVVDKMLLLVPKFSTLSVLGTTTLGVYVLHEWPMSKLGAFGFPWLPFPPWTRWAVAVVCFLTCHLVVSFIRSNPITSFLFFGPSGKQRFILPNKMTRPKR